ncbi:MAG TPA: dihydrodipicolinate synthase family protein [Candidatus Dormibacteraeota bacterium]|jgi:dihydrodipicolinate synthase/N-acetylneuraminate lyase|nr:dihydrodipicolinate synthase family protein [Candidatus Dormibacteraeota bacterium]
MRSFKGTVAACVTPLTAGGDEVDLAAIGPMVELLASSGLDGALALGTTGEGILLSPAERRQVADAFMKAGRGRLTVMVHCGAQTTRDTVELAGHAATIGAHAVAVIAPPYYPADPQALLDHFTAAGRACDPVPFFIYEFADRSGYPIPLDVIAELRQRLPNLAGLKVSDRPWERLEPYLLEGLAIFVGAEPLIGQGMDRGAVGAVSGMAAAFPEIVVRTVNERTEESQRAVGELRRAFTGLPLQAALKRVLHLRGVPIEEEVRGPLRTLTAKERAEVDRIAAAVLGTPTAPGGD